MKIIRFVFIVGFWTFMSRILGLIRDMMTAHLLGAGLLTDVFFTSFRIPNLFRRFFADGALSASFIPVYSGMVEEQPKRTRYFAGEMLATTTWLMLMFSVVCMIFMPAIVHVIAPGFVHDPEKFRMSVLLSRVMFPYLFFMMLAAQLSGILNSEKKFFASSAAPILLNLAFIVAIIASFYHWIAVPVVGIAWSVMISGFLQVLFLVYSCRMEGIKIHIFLLPRWTPAVKQVFTLMVPGILSAGITQINMLIGVIFASFLGTGAISYLYYANRMVQLPLAVIGMAIGTALLPVLSRYIKSGDKDGVVDSFNRSVEFAMLLAIPAAVGVALMAYPIISVFFKRGAFGYDQVVATAITLEAFALGLPAFVFIRILNVVFFAKKDMKTTSHISMWMLASNAIASYVLMHYLGYVGIALAISLTAWLNMLVCFVVLRRRRDIVFDVDFKKRIIKIVLSIILMGFALKGALFYLTPYYDSVGGWKYILLIGTVLWSMVVLCGAVIALRVFGLQDLKKILTK